MDNAALLSAGTRNYKPKRLSKKKHLAVQFDEDARREFLTGFSKRKKERKNKYDAKKKERARLERLENRAVVI